jgi:translation initiation factor IF-2
LETIVAKKAVQTRVFQLAKELAVSSKDVVAKCQAEGIPDITNHMSAVSLGLEATIREWFGVGGGVATAVETAAPVDVSKARAKAKRKSKSAADTEPDYESAAPAEEPEVRQPAEATAVMKPKPPVQPAAPPPTPFPAVPQPDDGTPPTPQPVKPRKVEHEQIRPAASKSTRSPVMNVPTRPDVVAPAGPRLEQPTKTQLAGPKVIRVEAPETIPVPRAKGPPRPGMPIARGGMRGGRGVGVPDTGESTDAGRARPGAGSRRNKRRSASATEGGRTGRAAVAPADADRPFNWREQDLLEREMRLTRAGGFFKAARRDNLKRSTAVAHRAVSAAESGGKVKIAEPITIKELSAATGVKAADILKKLFLKGRMVNINSAIDTETAMELMLEYAIELEVTEHKTAEEVIEQQFEDRVLVDEQPRAPVVTILGHVDHGKTSLLDRIRNANVAEGEAGGITQATSAFQVPVRLGEDERMVTFIDTPGHEAFTEMRARGAKVTDIVVLVVAADDGVMPQTVESINHAKAAGVPIVVALNKIDKPEATDNNIQRILGQLAEHELNPSEWGGSTEVIRTSAIKGEGIQDLLEVLDYQAQLLELKADFGGNAQGSVLEAKMEEGRGPVANILIQQGKLKKGDFIVVGRAYGRVRDIMTDRGQRVETAGPSMPVAISGINAVPDAGDKFYVVKSLRAAEGAAEERIDHERQRELATQKITLDNIFQHMAATQRKELPLVLKTDVHGSLETLRATLGKISTDEITVSIKHAGIGGINESDVSLAEASGAIVLGFNVTASGAARKASEAKSVDIRYYDVIYDIIDDVRKAAEGLLDPELKLEVLGHAEVRDVFKISKIGMVAGCYVTDGVIERNAQIRVTRDDIVVEKDRRLEQLKRFKDDVKDVRAGQECGMRIVGYDDIKVGDVLECYRTMEVRRKL